MNLMEIKMPFGDAVLTSGIGIVTVLIVLAVIAILIVGVSKVIRGFESAANKNKDASDAPSAAVPQVAPVANNTQQTMTGELQLIGTDEKTAAIIMAIVSNESGIPLNRLSFKSIKLMEE